MPLVLFQKQVQIIDNMALFLQIWLVLLVSIITQCDAIEYYVKPTDSTSSACPGQPCLSISEYTNDVAHYMKSNTVFTFLPGNHTVKKPIVFKHVHNVSLAALSSKHDTKMSTTQFMCQNVNKCAPESETSIQYCGNICCSVIGLFNVTNASIIGLTIDTNSVGITGATIQESRNVHVQIDIFGIEISRVNIFSKYFRYCGIIAINCDRLFVNGMQASHHSNEIVLLRTNNTRITNSLFSDSLAFGVRMLSLVNVSLLNTTISNSHYCTNVHLGRKTRSEKANLNLPRILDTHIIRDMYAQNNSCGILWLVNCTQIQVRHLFAESSQHYDNAGIIITSCTRIAVKNIVFSYDMTGFVISWCKHVYLMHITLHSNNNGDLSCGIHIANCTHTNMAHIYTYINNQRGINLISSNITIISHSLLTSERYAILTRYCRRTALVDVFITHLQNNGLKVMPTVGILMEISTTIILKNISLSLFRRTGLDFYKCSHVTLEHSTFSTIHPTTTKEYFLQPAIISLEDTSITLQNCVFTNNLITSIKAIGSNISLYGDLVFAYNQALYGGVFVLTQSSKLIFSEFSYVTFHNNSAVDYGGVFYISTKEFFIRSKSLSDIKARAKFGSETKSTTNCFFHVEGEKSKITLPFAGNTAGKGGDVLFGGLVALGWDGNVSCLDSFKNISDFSDQNEASVISSAPSRVCLCRDSQKDCLIVADPVTHAIYPGETLVIPAVVVGQDFGTVTGSVIAQLLVPSGLSPKSVIYLKEGQDSVLFENGPCKNFNYTFHTNCVDCKAVLVLKTDNAKVLDIMTTEDNDKLNYTWNVDRLSLPSSEKEIWRYRNDYLSELSTHAVGSFLNSFYGKLVFPKEIYNYPLYVNISFHSCPSGFSLTDILPFKCDCNNLLQKMPGVECTIQDQLISRGGSVWVGKYGNESVAASKYCPLNYCNSNEIKLTLINTDSSTHHNLTSIQCNYNHSGILCGGCQPGLSLMLGSDQCLKCSNYYVFLLLPCGIAGIILVLFIQVLNLTIAEGTLNGLIFYANVIKANQYLYYSHTSLNPITLFIAWLNLDLGIETCFVSGLTAYARTWLQFVFPLYIWSIACLIIILAKYSHRVAKVLGNNGVPVLATLFLLSYAKLFNTILTALSYTTLYTTEGQVLVWSADGNVAYLGPEHAPLFAVAVATLLFLWLPYTLLLLLGQWLHRFKFKIIAHFLLKLKPFLDAHYAVFKPRHHYWCGILLIVRASALLSSAIIPSDNVRIIMFMIATSSILLTYLGQNVYQNSAVCNFSATIFTNLALLNLTKLFTNDSNSEVSFNTLAGIALLQFTGLVFYKVVRVAKANGRVVEYFTLKCQWEAVVEDLELNVMAEAEREIESDSDED